MEWWKILSLVVAAIYVVGVVLAVTGDDVETTSAKDRFEGAAALLFWLALSLGCIWYGDELGEGLVGARFGLISGASPGWAIAFMGWVFLLAPVLVLVVRWLFGSGE